jgi:hypothetical protein
MGRDWPVMWGYRTLTRIGLRGVGSVRIVTHLDKGWLDGARPTRPWIK